MVVVEETLRARIRVLVVDANGDVASVLLTLPSYAQEDYRPRMHMSIADWNAAANRSRLGRFASHPSTNAPILAHVGVATAGRFTDTDSNGFTAPSSATSATTGSCCSSSSTETSGSDSTATERSMSVARRSLSNR